MVEPVGQLVDHLFRSHSGRMVATLARLLGPANLTLAEEVVQESLIRALELWPFHGVPENPTAWLVQVAKNRALDEIRRNRVFAGKAEQLAATLSSTVPAEEPETIADDQLRLMLMCCHPGIPRESQIALTLKSVGGFSVEEIAAAFLADPATVAQRIVRAKRAIREQGLSLDLPPRTELAARVDSLLEILYLTFSEGYSAHSGEASLRRDLSDEAIRLARLVVADPRLTSPKAHAVLALMLFQSARGDARIGSDGNLLTLEEQDHSRWDSVKLREAMSHFEGSIAGDEISEYHVQAAIAAEHSLARDYASTNWARIASLYDDLVAICPSPVVRLNRAVALAMVEGAESGLREIEAIAGHPQLRNYYLLPATRGELRMRQGDAAAAAADFRRALELPMNDAERRLLHKKLQLCLDQGDSRSTRHPSPSLR